MKKGDNEINVKLIVIVSVVMLVLLAALAIFLSKGKNTETEVDLTGLSSAVEFVGVDGKAEIKNKITIDENKKQQLLKDVDEDKRADVEKFLDSVSFTVDQTTNLSNDSYIIIEAHYDKQLAEECNIKVTEFTKKVKVSGLEEAPKLYSVSDMVNANIARVIWDNDEIAGVGLDSAYLGTKGSEQRVFLIQTGYTGEDDEEGNPIDFWCICISNVLTDNLGDTHIVEYENEEFNSSEAAYNKLKSYGYSLEKIPASI